MLVMWCNRVKTSIFRSKSLIVLTFEIVHNCVLCTCVCCVCVWETKLKCSIKTTNLPKLVPHRNPYINLQRISEQDKAAMSHLTSLWLSSRSLSGRLLYDFLYAAAGDKAALTAFNQFLWHGVAWPPVSTQAIMMSQTGISTKNFTAHRWTQPADRRTFYCQQPFWLREACHRNSADQGALGGTETRLSCSFGSRMQHTDLRSNNLLSSACAVQRNIWSTKHSQASSFACSPIKGVDTS